MSVKLTTETLLERSFYPLAIPLDPYNEAIWTAVDEPDMGLTSRTRMLQLPAVALATLVVHAAPAKSWRPDTRGMVTEASLRVAVWNDRNRRLSAWDMALSFQMLYFGGDGNRGGKIPRLGLDLLRSIDELSCEAIELWCSVPTIDDPYEFESVRLKTALARLASPRQMAVQSPI